MTLDFPNDSRCYDTGADAVRFWGYDSVLEVPFFIDAAALRRLVPRMSAGEAGCLEAFDAACERIHEVARKVYSRRARKASYLLAAADF